MMDIVKAICYPFYSARFYAVLMWQVRGIGMTFVLILCLLEMLSLGVHAASGVRQFARSIPIVAKTLPAVTMSHHTLAMDRPSPYVLDLVQAFGGAEGEHDRRKMLVVVDTDYVAENLDSLIAKMRDEQIVMLVTASQIVVAKGGARNAAPEIRITPFSSIPDGGITHEDWARYAEKVAFWALPILAVFLAIVIVIMNFVKVLFGAVVVMLISFFTKSVPSFDAALRLAAVTALTVGVLFLFWDTHPWLKFTLWCGYMVFGAVSARRPASRAAA